MKTEWPPANWPTAKDFEAIRPGACVLVPVSYCACALGIRNEDVTDRIESGGIRWAFDMATPGSKARCLRVWADCLARYQAGMREPQHLNLDEVIDSALGSHLPRLRASTLGLRWNLSRQKFGRILHTGLVEGEIVDHSTFLNRESLVRWLRAVATRPRSQGGSGRIAFAGPGLPDAGAEAGEDALHRNRILTKAKNYE